MNTWGYELYCGTKLIAKDHGYETEEEAEYFANAEAKNMKLSVYTIRTQQVWEEL